MNKNATLKLWVLSKFAEILSWSTPEELRQIGDIIRRMDDAEVCSALMSTYSTLTETVDSRRFIKVTRLPHLWSISSNHICHEK